MDLSHPCRKSVSCVLFTGKSACNMKDHSIKDLYVLCMLCSLVVSLVIWMAIPIFYCASEGTMKFSIEAKRSICTVKETVMTDHACIWDKKGPMVIYQCAKATIEFQVDGTEAFVTILDSDFAEPLIGSESRTRMAEHISEDWSDGSNHTCAVIGDEVRFEVIDPLFYYVIIGASFVPVLALLSTYIVSIVCKEAIDSTAEVLGQVMEVNPASSSEESTLEASTQFTKISSSEETTSEASAQFVEITMVTSSSVTTSEIPAQFVETALVSYSKETGAISYLEEKV